MYDTVGACRFIRFVERSVTIEKEIARALLDYGHEEAGPCTV